MNDDPRRIVVPTDHGPVEVAFDWWRTDPLADAVQPSKVRLTAERIYDGLEWTAVADIRVDEHLLPTALVATLLNLLHDEDASEAARRSWTSEATRFTHDHVTDTLILSLVRAGADDWLRLTGRRVDAFRRRLAQEQEAHRRAILAHALAHHDDAAVRVAAVKLLDSWEGSAHGLLDQARRTVEDSNREAPPAP